MNTRLDAGESPFDSPASYRICVQGRISESWSDRLEGLSMAVEQSDNTPPITTLWGLLSDQAALAGILKTIYELHLPVIYVVRVDDETGDVTH